MVKPMTSPYDEMVDPAPDLTSSPGDDVALAIADESRNGTQVLVELAETTRLIRQIDSKLNAINRDLSPIAAQASQTIDARFKRAMDPLLRCVDTVRQLQAEPDGANDTRLMIIANELEGVLDGLNIERFADDAFDPSRQRVIEQRDTSNKALHGTIAASRYDGYRVGATIVRPQGVVVYKFKESA